MNNKNLPDKIKAILLKVALVLKNKYQWRSNKDESDVNLSLGAIELTKQGRYDDIGVSSSIVITFEPNEAGYQLVLDWFGVYSNGVSEEDFEENNIILSDLPFTETDTSNSSKIEEAADFVEEQVNYNCVQSNLAMAEQRMGESEKDDYYANRSYSTRMGYH